MTQMRRIRASGIGYPVPARPAHIAVRPVRTGTESSHEIQEDVMGLISHVIAAGIGYYAGQPEGRRQLEKLRRQAVEYAHGPEVKRLRERGWDVAGEGAHAAKNFASRIAHKDAAGADSTAAGEVAETGSGQSRVLWRRSRPGRQPAAEQTSGSATPGPESPASTGSSAGTGSPASTAAESSAGSGVGTGSPAANPAPPSGAEKRP